MPEVDRLFSSDMSGNKSLTYNRRPHIMASLLLITSPFQRPYMLLSSSVRIHADFE